MVRCEGGGRKKGREREGYYVKEREGVK